MQNIIFPHIADKKSLNVHNNVKQYVPLARTAAKNRMTAKESETRLFILKLEAGNSMR